MEQEAVVQSVWNEASKPSLQRFAILVAQLSIYPALLLMRLLLVRDKRYCSITRSDLELGAGESAYVLYANHQSKLDALIICASLPFGILRQLLPFRFFVENSYFQGAMSIFLKIMGGFPAHYEAGRAYGLDGARAVMATRQTVMIFPQGMRTRQPIAKPGIAILASEQHVQLIPVHIDWKHRWQCSVHIGKPVQADPLASPDDIMQLVYALPGS